MAIRLLYLFQLINMSLKGYLGIIQLFLLIKATLSFLRLVSKQAEKN
jgi:hypothetical protein